jgi:hypothetical protein
VEEYKHTMGFFILWGLLLTLFLYVSTYIGLT